MFENIEITKETAVIFVAGVIATFYLNKGLERFHNSADRPYFIAFTVVLVPLTIYIAIASWGHYSALSGDAQFIMSSMPVAVIIFVYIFSAANPKFAFSLLVLYFILVFTVFDRPYFPMKSNLHGDLFVIIACLPYIVYVIFQTLLNAKVFSVKLIRGWNLILKIE